ncbi:siroheme synthase CysG [Roseibium suaedae]|uniref:Uroporphyrinogen-III C-methyltransferase n=1 Tax=Roseibium suaedae TaxID=735517 RepID=A0A1M7PR34_9HYPH|nr:siroheme synthase CysG [Roseibium suaedae]SHN19676.1 uroporphyrinogen-III C-methyltransferase [Roseibium suaedae]
MTVSRKPVEVPRPTAASRETSRMGPLACLPVFFNLEGRKAVVAGGSAAAAWKAELLAASGAVVHVHAAELSPEMENLLQTGSVKGSFVHHAATWSPACLSSAALAIADAEDDSEAEAFAESARSAGVPYNVIDNPGHCAFQFGSIVNRSPVVIGISTNGVAPILGQAIRRRIETLLPRTLSDWAALAGRVRADVMARLAPGRPRRQFWEGFTEKAFGDESAPRAEDDMPALVDELCARNSTSHAETKGKVTLVGAGPGAADHLTIKAVRALQGADVILFDDLVSSDVLELARREARRMMVGKRGGRESCRQEDINELMLTLARQGKSVVRLKSGDPMIFGRAGEEIDMLEREGIEVSVVPGITAATAMASGLKVSLTHRDHAQSVRFVTGHSRKGELPDTVDWQALTDPAATTVFYMGGRMSGRIRDRLLSEGCNPALPVCAMANISRPEEVRWAGQLSDLEQGVGTLSTDGPVLIALGEVFHRLSEKTNALPSGGFAELRRASGNQAIF